MPSKEGTRKPKASKPSAKKQKVEKKNTETEKEQKEINFRTDNKTLFKELNKKRGFKFEKGCYDVLSDISSTGLYNLYKGVMDPSVRNSKGKPEKEGSHLKTEKIFKISRALYPHAHENAKFNYNLFLNRKQRELKSKKEKREKEKTKQTPKKPKKNKSSDEN